MVSWCRSALRVIVHVVLAGFFWYFVWFFFGFGALFSSPECASVGDAGLPRCLRDQGAREARTSFTETNRIQLVLFDKQNREARTSFNISINRIQLVLFDKQNREARTSFNTSTNRIQLVLFDK
jgi:hypothetical protein